MHHQYGLIYMSILDYDLLHGIVHSNRKGLDMGQHIFDSYMLDLKDILHWQYIQVDILVVSQ